MTSTDITTTTDIVDRLLTAIRTASPVTGLYRDDARLDATVPNWRFTLDGAAAIVTEYGHWFAHPGRFSELRRTPISDGEVVEYTLRWIEDGVPRTTCTCSPSTAPANRSPQTECGAVAAGTPRCWRRWGRPTG